MGGIGQVFARMAPGPDAGDKAALLLQILGNLSGMKNNFSIEKSKSKHQNKIKNSIKQLIIKSPDCPFGRLN